MRKQYHFRPSDRGLLAWDVGRLVELAEGLPAIEVPLTEIAELDEPYWNPPGGPLPTPRDYALHLRLVAETNLSFPIILCPDRRVMDGMHRVVKALDEGRETIRAVVLPNLPEPDYVGKEPEELPY